MADELRFLCDEMLAGLGRWLRIAGYDTAIASGGRRDRDLVKQAHAEQRILLTRDRRVVEIRPANDRTVVLENDGIDACAKELGQRLIRSAAAHCAMLGWNGPITDSLCRCRRVFARSAPRCRSARVAAACTGRAATSAAYEGVSRPSRPQRPVKELSRIKSSIVPTRRFDPTCCLVQSIAPVRSNMVSSHRAVITSFRRM